jgi:hypothetical protein
MWIFSVQTVGKDVPEEEVDGIGKHEHNERRRHCEKHDDDASVFFFCVWVAPTTKLPLVLSISNERPKN